MRASLLIPFLTAACTCLASAAAECRAQDQEPVLAAAPLVLTAPALARTWRAVEHFLLPLPGVVGARLGPKIGIAKLAAGRFLSTSIDEAIEALGAKPWTMLAWPRSGPWRTLLLTTIAEPQRVAVGQLLSKLEGGVILSFADGVLKLASDPEVLQHEYEPGVLATGSDPLRAAAALAFHFDLEHQRAFLHARKDAAWEGLDGAGRLLVGPLAAWLDRAQSMSGSLEIGSATNANRVLASIDFAPADAVAGHPAHALLGPAPAKVAKLPADGIARLVLSRSLVALFETPERLLREDDAAKFASSRSILDALAVGRSFAKDLIPALGPLALYVLEQSVDAKPQGAAPRPRLTLPVFVMTAEMRSPAGQKLLERLFDAIATISFFERAQQNKPVFERRVEQVDGFTVRTLAIDEWRGPAAPPVEVGLTPTLLFAHGHAILASTKEGALRLAIALAARERDLIDGDALVVRGAPLARLVGVNRAIVTLGRLFDEGESLVDAQWFADALADVAAAIERFEITWRGSRLEIELVRGDR